MNSFPLDNVTRARLPTTSLAALAGLRRDGGISVIVGDPWSWIFWEPGDDQALRAVLPIGQATLFERRGDEWHQPGRHLPDFGVCSDEEPRPLHQVILPESFATEPAGDDPLEAVRLCLERDDRPRAATGASCPMTELLAWADRAPTASIAAIRGAFAGDSALLLGDHLPLWPGSERFWGRSLLVPLGFAPRPALPERSLREALGAGEGDLLRLVLAGDGSLEPEVEFIALDQFRPLTRAGVRLASERAGTGG